jgi:poly-gamma-glutamate capsule biosynthesis protein CapA/YwtB (metallophosphatase superfamily)
LGTTQDDKSVLIYAVGDVCPDRPGPVSIFHHVSCVLGAGDIWFGQLEPTLSHTTKPDWVKAGKTHDPRMVAAALKASGINIFSFASNHCMDDGVGPFLETIDCLKHEKLNIIGVGRNIEEARKPAIFECKGKRIAFLAYNSAGKPHFWAQNNKPGCAPLRVSTLYEPLEPAQPGTPAQVHTFPYREDVAAMRADVSNAGSQADKVIVSMHCGIHITPVAIADYQVDLAHAAIDAGADLILQHHAHILKGIEVYRGKVIFYGLGNFAIEVHFMTREWAESPEIREVRKALNPDWHPPYPDYPSFPFPPDSRKTIVVKYVISNNSISRVSFLPALINQQSQPEILLPDNAQFQEVVDYVDVISREAGFSTSFQIDGDEVLIIT